MKEIDMDLHDDDSSYDSEFDTLEINSTFAFDDSGEEMELEKEMIFYRRLEDY